MCSGEGHLVCVLLKLLGIEQFLPGVVIVDVLTAPSLHWGMSQ